MFGERERVEGYYSERQENEWLGCLNGDLQLRSIKACFGAPEANTTRTVSRHTTHDTQHTTYHIPNTTYHIPHTT